MTHSSLAVWGTMKKKPLMTVKDAHSGQVEEGKVIDGVKVESNVKCWITAVAALPHTDLLVSGLYPSHSLVCALPIFWFVSFPFSALCSSHFLVCALPIF